MDKKLTKEDIINVAKCCITGNCESCPLENDEKCYNKPSIKKKTRKQLIAERIAPLLFILVRI